MCRVRAGEEAVALQTHQEEREEKRFEETIRRSKRGFFHVAFGRSTVIILLLLLQIVLMFAAFVYLGQYLMLFFGGVVAFTAVMLVWILNTEKNTAIKLTWCIVISVLPAFGALLYIYVNADVGHRIEKRRIEQMVRESEVYVPDQSALMQRLEGEKPALCRLAQYTRSHGGFPIYEHSSVRYFPLGEDKFAEMLRQLEGAKRFIFLEYFIVEEGCMWDSVLEILARKAKEGVEVRVMYDGTCAINLLPYGYPKELEKLGIRCKMFSPLHPLVSTHYNNRDHRKILVIDGHTAFTGGVNLADEYINRKVRFGHWKDTVVMIKGEAVRSFTMMFLQMWNATEKECAYEPYLNVPVPLPISAPGYVIPYGDNPMDDDKVGEMVYLDILNRATRYVYIMTPYLILDNEMITGLCFAAKRGVDVRIILPHIPDKKYAFVLAQSHYRELIRAGVKIYEYTPGFVHAKVFVSDDARAVVGTINLDYRSLYLHFECSAYMEGVPAVADVLRDFHSTQEKCKQVTLQDVNRRKLTSRLAGAILKVIAPLM